MGIDFPSLEHAYQASKTLNRKDQKWIASLELAKEAKRAGRKVKMRSDWEQIKIPTMRALLRIKFSDNADLREALLMTHPAYLEETNYWGDTFWGVCNGEGENHLGKLLMEVRDEIKGN